MQFIASGASVKGPAHISDNLPNQDALSLRGFQGGWIAGVADGLGSAILSDKGSRLAVQSVQHCLRQKNVYDPAFINAAIYKKWLNDVYPFKVQQLATTCLYARVLADGNCLLGQLGDGLIIYRSAGKLFVMTPNRAGFSNQTDALTNRHNPSQWVNANFVMSQTGDGVILLTDGISDDLIPETLASFFDTIYKQCIKLKRRHSKNWLEREFTDWATPKHGDDKTLAAIFRKI